MKGGLKWWASLPRETGGENESPGAFLGLLPCLASGDHSVDGIWVGPAIRSFPDPAHGLVVTGRGLQVESQNFTFGGEGARLLTYNEDEDEGKVLSTG